MSARAVVIHATLDFSRPYRDVVTKRGTYVMEDWLHFTETFSVAVLAPEEAPRGRQPKSLLPAPFDEMWMCLRTAGVHYFRASRSELSAAPEEVDRAHNALFRYAELLEAHVGVKACKSNLHLLVDRY